MKKWIGFLLFSLVISNGYWLYTSIDNAVTLHCVSDSVESTAKTLEQAIRTANLNAIGIDADVALKQLNPTVYGLEPFEKEGCVYADQVCLELDETRTVISVRQP